MGLGTEWEVSKSTVRMPWELRPGSRFTSLFEAQVLVMAMSGMTVSAIASLVGEGQGRVWRILGRAVGEARGRHYVCS